MKLWLGEINQWYSGQDRSRIPGRLSGVGGLLDWKLHRKILFPEDFNITLYNFILSNFNFKMLFYIFINHKLLSNQQQAEEEKYKWTNSLFEWIDPCLSGRTHDRNHREGSGVDLGSYDYRENTTNIIIFETWVLMFPLVNNHLESIMLSFNSEIKCSLKKTFSFENVVPISSLSDYWITYISKGNMYRRNQPICRSEKNGKTSRGFNKNTKKKITNTLNLKYHALQTYWMTGTLFLD